MAPCFANWNAWVPPPLLTAGFVFEATDVENFATKFDQAMAWYFTDGRPLFGLYAWVIRWSIGLKVVPPQGMFQNWIVPPLEPAPPPEEQAASASDARPPPARPAKARRESA